MGNSACLYVGEQMTLDEMLNAIERLQAVYVEFTDEQSKSKEKIRWAINHLSDKIWSETL
jgi:hypothetical protein